jgi:hypothetical protein
MDSFDLKKNQTLNIFLEIGGSSITFSGQSTNSDDITQVPGGSIDLSVTAKSSQSIPEGVMLMKLVRRESDNVIVPCLDGISGSWYDFIFQLLYFIK